MLVAVSAGGAAYAAPPEPNVTALIDRALHVIGNEDAAHSTERVETGEDIAEQGHAEVELGELSVGVTNRDIVDSEIRETPGGIQALAVLRQGESTASFDLTLPDGASLEPSSDGGLDILLRAEAVVLGIGHIDAPWAVDADGTSLPTSYEVLGESLVQHVDTTGATYPVVADPNLTFGLWNSAYGPGVYLNLTGFEIKAYASVIIAAGGAALLATCVLAKVPVQIRSLLQLLCGAVGTPTIGTVLGTIQAANGNSSYKNNTCYQTLLASSHPFVKTARDQCTFGNV